MKALPGLTDEQTTELAKPLFTSVHHALSYENLENVEGKAEHEIQMLHDNIDYEYEAIKSALKTARNVMTEWDVKLQSYNKATEFFEKCNYCERASEMSKKQRLVELTTALSNNPLDIKFRAARNKQILIR